MAAKQILSVTSSDNELFELPTNNGGPITVATVTAELPDAPTTFPEDVNAAAPLIGTSPQFAREDHKHSAEVADPVSVGTANATGSAPELSRADHVHALSSPAVPAAYAAAWAVADWYIDGTIGNDANNGTTALTPLRTGAELSRRLGPYAIWSQSVTIHVLANGMTDPLVARGVMTVSGSVLTIDGTPTVLATDSVAAYAGVNHATPTATQVTFTTAADVTAFAWRRIRCTAGSQPGTICWIARSNPGGAGLNVARVSPPIRIDQTSLTAGTAASTFAFNDTIVVESLPKVPAISVFVDSASLATNVARYRKRAVEINSVDCQVVQVAAPATLKRSCGLLFGLRTLQTVWVSNGSPISNLALLNGCLIAYDDVTESGAATMSGNYSSCLFGDGLVSANFGQANWLNCLFQNCRCLSQAATMCFASSVQCFDLAASSSTFNVWNCQATNLSGDNNATIGIAAVNGTYLKLQGTINLKGGTTECQLATAPTINLSTAQFRQPNDFAQKGTSTLVGGTVTVTVPWWDPTTQKLTFSRNTPGGAVGDLSAPIASRTSTQFVINSASGTDTSTVDWQISPLGRNVFVTPN